MVSSIATGTDNKVDCGCYPNGLPKDASVKGIQALGEPLFLTAGESVNYTSQVLNSGYIKINRLAADDQTLETETNHCLKPDQPVHFFYGEGICSSEDIGSCLYVATTPTDNSFTLRDGETPPNTHTFKATALTDPDPTVAGMPVTAWVAEAGDLSGYRTRLRLVLGDCRSARLLSVGAIQKDSDQVQLKGEVTGIITGDKITVGSYTGTVISATKIFFKGVCYTICHMEQKATEDVPFTLNKVASLEPYQHIIEATAPALDCGWASVSIPGNLTRDLCRYKTHQTEAHLVGSWDFSMIWGKSGTGPDELPPHIAEDYSNAYWISVFDKGGLYV